MANINLTENQWAKALAEGESPEKLADNILNGNFLPWVWALQECMGDSNTALSLGEGRGDVSAVLALQGIRPTLLDWSEENISFSQRLFKLLGVRGDYCCWDMQETLPFTDNAFDTVFLCSVLQYFNEKERKRILKESFRVARKKVIAVSPNALCAAYRVGKWYMEQRKKWPWGNEKPFVTFKPLFQSVGAGSFREFSVAGLHSLEFLTMKGGTHIKSWLIRTLKLKQHSAAVAFRQGYMLFAVGEKNGNGHQEIELAEASV